MAGVFGCGYARMAVKAIFAPSKDHPKKIDQRLKEFSEIFAGKFEANFAIERTQFVKKIKRFNQQL